MKFYSTRQPQAFVELAEAVLQGLPPDNGLYMPERLEALTPEFWREARNVPFVDVALAMTKQLVGDSVPTADLEGIVVRACAMDAPLAKVDDRFVLELFHGPTLAFKDFGARFMAQLLAWLNRGADQQLHILVATSGDTGGAVAAGFAEVSGIEVTILYPQGKVSPLQEKQLTTWGGNIRALEIDGTFDDCQALVKQAFLNMELQRHLRLCSANSINIARLIPQSWYYARAWQQLPEQADTPVFCVPSGNFGNLTGGLFAQRLGLPVHHFVAATNANDTVPRFLTEGHYLAKPSVETLSNAMDVGNPSNVQRLMDLLGETAGDWERHLTGISINDSDTLATLRRVWEQHGYCLDPHGAVGWAALDKLSHQWPGHPHVLLETAHPAKFPEVLARALGGEPPSAEALERLRHLPSQKTSLPADSPQFNQWLMDHR